MKKILVTGATGFVGHNLVSQFYNVPDYKITCLVRNVAKAKSLLPTEVEIISRKDISSLSNKDIDYVVHLASCLTSKDDTDTMKSIVDVNLVFSTELLDALKYKKNLKFINFGSFAEFRFEPGKIEPAYLYTATKQAFHPILDFYAKNGLWDYIHLIPYTIYGGDNNQKKLIDYVRDSLDAKIPVKMSPGYQVSDFVHVNDVIDCVKYLIDNSAKWEGTKGDTFHLGTGKGTSIRELAMIFEKLTHKKSNIDWGGISYRTNDIMHAVAPIGKLTELGWSAKIDLESGLLMSYNL